MSSLLLSLFTFIVFLFHLYLRSLAGRGRVRESFCAGWCMDAVFAICGILISFSQYHYTFLPYITLRNFILLLFYLLIAVLFVFLTPSGFFLFTKRSSPSEEELLLAEFRFNEIFSTIRGCLFILLFALPLLLALSLRHNNLFFSFTGYRETEFLGGFCFVAFLILAPVSLRQSLFWLKSLKAPVSPAANRLLLDRQTRVRCKKRNVKI